MPNLPTLTVTQAQADQLVQVFGTQQGYLDWLRGALRGEVMARKARAIQDKAQNDIDTQALAAADAVIPGA